MPNNKNQHIVPQFYQRFFSNDGKSIGKYVIHLRKSISSSSIKKTACEDYYYDDKDFIESGNQTIEKTLDIIETGAAIAIHELIQNGEKPLHPKDFQFLYSFIGLQILRTRPFAKRTEKVSSNILKELNAQIQNIFPNLVITNDIKPHIASLKHAASMTMSLLDLRYKVLEISIPDSFFLTSDNPVSQFNPFLYKQNIYNQGPALVGSLVFMPISPVKGILLYDSQVYKIGTKKSNTVQIRQKADVDSLNLLTCLNAYDELLYNPSNQPYFCFTNLIERVSKLRKIERKKRQEVNVSETETIPAYIAQKTMQTKLSFVKVLDKARSYHLQNVLWDPILIRPTCQLYNRNQNNQTKEPISTCAALP